MTDGAETHPAAGAGLSAVRMFAAGGPLGFGTGFLHHAGDRAVCVRLLREAFDAGVTYYDTARLYGEGACETMLAEAFAGKRSEVFLATKVGILPPQWTLGARISAKAAHIMRKAPPLRAVVAEPEDRHPVFGVFDRPRMQASFEASLKALKTDHVDLLLLHECTLEDVQRDEVQHFLGQMVRDGKAKAWGVAPTPEAMLGIAHSGVAYGEVAQFDGAIRSGFPPEGAPSPALIITHSCLGEGFREMAARLQQDEVLKARWSAALGLDAGDPGVVAQAFLARAMQQNPGGIVLFSTTRDDRLRRNLEAASWLDMPDRMAALPGILPG
ncbi:aldo/keto reductase [Hyphomonas sp.]|uniref:aldo/keto reductase n=1 Tax=Hyphomonas sp. TaxID=87 RepID=UPI00391A580A